MDIFAEHGVAGIVGLIFNALFGVDYVVGLDGVNTGGTNPQTGTAIGGWPIGNYRQLYVQLAYVLACSGYAFVMSAILAYIVNFIPGLHLRASEEAELLGMDDDQLGEFAYDYVEVCSHPFCEIPLIPNFQPLAFPHSPLTCPPSPSGRPLTRLITLIPHRSDATTWHGHRTTPTKTALTRNCRTNTASVLANTRT